MSRYKRVPLNTLKVDERYQRPLDEKRVAKIARDFDERLFGTLEISQRNGKSAVFDGQHRLAAAQQLGMKDVPCLVHSNLEPEEEARLFVALQQNRRGIKPVDKFVARVFAGDEQAVEVDSIIREVGYEVRPSNGGRTGAIQAITTVEWVYRRYGAKHLTTTLEFIRDLWAGDDHSTDGSLVSGVAQFLDGYGNRVGDAQLERLGEVSPTLILRRALGQLQGGGIHARHQVDAELRKVSGVRGRPTRRKAEAEAE